MCHVTKAEMLLTSNNYWHIVGEGKETNKFILSLYIFSNTYVLLSADAFYDKRVPYSVLYWYPGGSPSVDLRVYGGGGGVMFSDLFYCVCEEFE